MVNLTWKLYNLSWIPSEMFALLLGNLGFGFLEGIPSVSCVNNAGIFTGRKPTGRKLFWRLVIVEARFTAAQVSPGETASLNLGLTFTR